MCSDVHKLLNSTFNKEELPYQQKEPVVLPVYKRDKN
jgi:hypothetical protein